MKITHVQDPIQLITDLASIYDADNIDTAVMADIETNNLYGRLRTIQLYCKAYSNETYFIDFDLFRDIEDEILDEFKNLWTVWANPSYDFGVLRFTTTHFDDVQQLARLAYPKLSKTLKGFALDNIISKVAGIDAYVGMDKKTLQKAGFNIGVELTEEQVKYACSDVYYMYNVWIDKRIQHQRATNISYSIDTKALRESIKYQQNAILFHQPSLLKEKTDTTFKDIDEKEILEGISCNSHAKVRRQLGYPASDAYTLLKLVGGYDVWFTNTAISLVEFACSQYNKTTSKQKEKDNFKTNLIEDMEEDSTKVWDRYRDTFLVHTTNEKLRGYKLREVKDKLSMAISNGRYELNDALHLKSIPQIIKYLDSASTTLLPIDDTTSLLVYTNEEIEDLKDRATYAKAVFDNRRTVKRLGYINQYLLPKGDTNEFKPMYTYFNPYGAVTGRFTSKGGDDADALNLQQIPRDLQYTTFMDTEDTVVVHADYSTAELRTACSLMADPAMYQYLKDGVDLHKVSATFAIDKMVEDITKEERQKGKAISFGLIFGMGIATFIQQSYKDYGVLFTEEEAKAIIAKYMKTYKAIAKYIAKAWDNYKKTPCISPSGRVSMADTGNAYINFPTQSGVADMTKLATIYMIKDHPIASTYIFNVVHDAIYLRVPRGEETMWAKLLVEYMKMGYTEYVKLPMFTYKDIPQPVEVEYNDYSNGEAVAICKEY